MIRKTLPALALVATVSALPLSALLAQSNPDLTAVINATVRVENLTTGRDGTGWIIESTNERDRAGAAVIATSLNLVENGSVIQVREPSTGDSVNATILRVDTDRNLAFLEVKDITAQAIEISIDSPSIGSTVFAAGFNRDADDSERAKAATATVKRGVLSREYRGPISVPEARADVNQLELDASLIRGFEGSPLVDDCGRVIGINMKSGGRVGRRNEMEITDGDNEINALKADEIVAFANAANVTFRKSDGACGGGAASSSTAASESGAEGEATPTTAATATPTPSSSGMMAWIQENIVLVLLMLLGVIAAVYGLITLTRRKPEMDYEDTHDDPPPPGSFGTQTGTEGPAAAAGTTAAGTTMMGGAGGTTKEEELRLTGRVPGGSAIDLRIPRSSVEGKKAHIGSDPGAEIVLNDNREKYKVSREHAIIGHDGKTFTIADNKSTNGTSLNGEKLSEPYEAKPLVHGDTLSFADVELKVSVS